MVRRSSQGRPRGAGRTANEGLEESSTCKMGVQVSCGNLAEIPWEGIVWQIATRDRGDIARTVSSKRHRTGGGECCVGSYPHGVGDSTQVQCGDDDGVSERQECREDTQGTCEDKGNSVWTELLGSGVLREHRRTG